MNVIRNRKRYTLVDVSAFIAFAFICLMIFMPPYIKYKYPDCSDFYYYDLQYYMAAIGIVILAFKPLKKSAYAFLLLIVSYYGIITLSTYIQHNPVLYTCIISYGITTLCFGIVLAATFESKHFKEYLFIMILILEVIVIINLISVILYPQGLYKAYGNNNGTVYWNPAYFLGHKNNAIEYIAPLIGLIIYYDHINKKHSINYWIVLVISAVTALKSDATNELLCVVFALGISLLLFIFEDIPFLRIFNGLVVSAVATILFAGVQIQMYFEDIIIKVLHRDATFTTRTDIWSHAINWIFRSPIYGYGIEPADIKRLKIHHSNSAHNFFFDFLYSGGIIELIAVLLMVVLVIISVRAYKERTKAWIAIPFCTYFIMWIATPVHVEYMYIMFSFFMISMLLPMEKINTKKALIE